MGYRTVIITTQCKLSYKNEYLQILNENLRYIHLSEISVLIIESTRVYISTTLLSELARHKIKVIFCDEQYNPYSELLSKYDRFNSSKKIMLQLNWSNKMKIQAGDKIIRQKIMNQSLLLDKYGFSKESLMLRNYADGMQESDITNREGHAAKVYFNALFGKDFSRGDVSDINAGLNYGYSIILSAINREIVVNGCITQIGLKHINEYNDFNLSYDIIEIFRVIVDEFIYNNKCRKFDIDLKHQLVGLLNKKVILDKEYYLMNAFAIVTKSIIDALDTSSINQLNLYKFQ